MSDLELESNLDGHVEQLWDTKDALLEHVLCRRPQYDVWHDPHRTERYDTRRRELQLEEFVLSRLIGAFHAELRRRRHP